MSCYASHLTFKAEPNPTLNRETRLCLLKACFTAGKGNNKTSEFQAGAKLGTGGDTKRTAVKKGEA